MTTAINMDDPTCTDCGAQHLTAYSWTETPDGVPASVWCMDCKDKHALADYRADGRLTTRLTMAASMKAFYAREAREKSDCDPTWLEIADASQRVHAHGKRFDREVWFGGLQKQVRAAKRAGMEATPISSTLGHITMLTFTTAGRALMTLRTDTAEVTLITAEDESTSRMGVQGIDATEVEAITLIDTVIRAWKAGTVTMSESQTVGLG